MASNKLHAENIGSAAPSTPADATCEGAGGVEGGKGSFGEAVSRHAAEMRASRRYPLTYAYDWIKGTICTEMSRSEASHRISVACERLGISKDDVVLEMAEQYIAHWSVSCANDELADQQRQAWATKLAEQPEPPK